MAWSSSNVLIATVVARLVAGVAAGTAYIVASTEGRSGSSAITVNPLPTGQCGAWPSGIASWIAPLALSTGQTFYASPTGI